MFKIIIERNQYILINSKKKTTNICSIINEVITKNSFVNYLI